MGETIQVPMGRVEEVCNDLLAHLEQKGEKVAYAQLGAALVICRLSSPDGLPSPEQEVKFIEDMMSWVNMYWGEGTKALMN